MFQGSCRSGGMSVHIDSVGADGYSMLAYDSSPYILTPKCLMYDTLG